MDQNMPEQCLSLQQYTILANIIFIHSRPNEFCLFNSILYSSFINGRTWL